MLRPAESKDVEAIRELVVADSGGNVELLEYMSWDDSILPYWIVEEQRETGELVGCIQVLRACPWGYLESMAVSRELSPSKRARVVKRLLEKGCEILADTGVRVVSGLVPSRMVGYRKALKRRGCEIMHNGSRFVRRIA